MGMNPAIIILTNATIAGAQSMTRALKNARDHQARGCCRCGCRYGDLDCPVRDGEVPQTTPCNGECDVWEKDPY